MAYTNSDLGDFAAALKQVADAWAGDFDADKAEVGELFQPMLEAAETYYRSGGDRPPIPPRTL